MMDAILFDFDGVIVDSEPTHLRCFQAVLKGVGIELTRDEYYSQYLGFDDHDCFAAILAVRGRKTDEPLLESLTARKTALVQEEFAQSIQALPGSVELLRSAREARVPTAICSGALRAEIELAARTAGALEHVLTIVAAQDVRHGKPDPEGYLQALQRLRHITGSDLQAARTVIVEDAPAGIAAGKAAGMKALAVTTSYPASELQQADRIVKSLADVSLADVGRLVDRNP